MPNLNGNWVDLIIIVILLYFASEAWRFGLWVILADFISFLASLLISLRAFKFAASLLKSNFSLPSPIANALGFLFTALVVEAVLGFILGLALKRLPAKLRKSRVSRIFAVVPAVGQGIVLIAFLLPLLVSLPVKPTIKTAISDSRLGGLILTRTSAIETKIDEIFGDVIKDSLTYLTIKPESRESVPLTVEKTELNVDEVSEAEMFKQVNLERQKNGREQLVWRPELVPVARAHARDMWERKYFSHYSPEGKDVGDRLEKAGIRYFVAGENLALAPTVAIAMNGLMNSEGHRANILSPEFKRVGIGVIDNGYYGKMFVQIFTD